MERDIETTPLDAAHAAMEAGEAGRRAFWAALAGSELHLILAADPGDGPPEPLVMETSEGAVALAFDRMERLGAFLDAPAPCAALSGRRLLGLLAGRGLALGLNLGVARSSVLLPAEAVAWAAGAQADAGAALALAPERIGPPRASPELIAALDARLAALAGLAEEAWLVEIGWRDGGRSLALALPGLAEGLRAGAVEALGEAHRLTGGEGAFDVLFPEPGDPALAAFRRQGLGFSLPAPRRQAPGPPGTDPDRPPKLR